MSTKTQPPGSPEIAVALKQGRTAKRLSQRRLGELVGVGHPYISRIEDGSRWPTRTLAQRIADVIGPEVMIAAGYIPAGYRVVKDR